MKHISKFDTCEYQISESVALGGIASGKGYRDDIILIWRDPQCGFEEAAENGFIQRELVGWYWGDYDYKVTEGYIKEYYQNKLSEEK